MYLRCLRRKSHLSQQEIANLMGVSQQYYSFIEGGTKQKDMTLSNLEKLARVFNLSLQEVADMENGYRNEVQNDRPGIPRT